jgi:hypothetical protein
MGKSLAVALHREADDDPRAVLVLADFRLGFEKSHFGCPSAV